MIRGLGYLKRDSARAKRAPICLFILIIFLFSGIFSFVFATAPEAPLPGWDPEAVERKDLLPAYIRYLFNFSLIIVGLIAFGVLVYAGFCYLTSAGNPTKMSDALDRIWAAFLGLVILLGSYLILVTIDPQLVMPRLEPLIPVPGAELAPGVYLVYTENEEEKFFGPFLFSHNNLDEYVRILGGKKIERIRIVNPGPPVEYFYGAILHMFTDFEGYAEIYRTAKGEAIDKPLEWNIEIKRPRSLTVFRQVEKAGIDDKVVLYSEPEFKGKPKTLTEATEHGIRPSLGGLDVWSIDIVGNYLLVLYGSNVPQHRIAGPYYAVFRGPGKWSNLKGHPMNQCGAMKILFWWIYQRSCATHYEIYSIL